MSRPKLDTPLHLLEFSKQTWGCLEYISDYFRITKRDTVALVVRWLFTTLTLRPDRPWDTPRKSRDISYSVNLRCDDETWARFCAITTDGGEWPKKAFEWSARNLQAFLKSRGQL